MEKTRNSIDLADFVRYCQANPNQRFWQALKNWSGAKYIGIYRGSGWVEKAFPGATGWVDTYSLETGGYKELIRPEDPFANHYGGDDSDV